MIEIQKNMDMLVEKSNKYCIDIVKGTNNLRQIKIAKNTPNLRRRE